MPEASPDQSMHLPSLVIKNFRGIDELTIPRLGRVTLLAGKNGVGKTTVLDAVRVWAGRGHSGVFDTVLVDRGDSFIRTLDGQPDVTMDRIALFTNRDYGVESVISIGPNNTHGSTVHLQEDQFGRQGRSEAGSLISPFLGNIGLESRLIQGEHSDPEEIACNTMGPNAPSEQIVEQYWSEVALTSHEDRALEALNLITDGQVERIAALGPPVNSNAIQPRRVMAKVKGKDYQVPLRSLGDGAMRTYAVALALAKSSGGFLLIDEAENGIHHTIQPKFWKMVLQTAKRNNVQVIATTHSWDCVTGFAQAANELEDAEGLLVRIQRVPIGLRAITYDESRLENIAKHGIEVR